MESLRQHFAVVTGEEAASIIRNGVAEDDLVLRSGGEGPDPDATAIESAGQALIDFHTDEIERMNSVERLRRIEELLAEAVRNVMRFDHFEIRLINKRSSQLELVIAVGLKPLDVGQLLYARAEDGISGFVATSGQSYLCRDVRSDPRYAAGLEGARSSLTVPLKLHGEVIGTFNIESDEENAFTDLDRRHAERLGAYIAVALHMLDLLVVERYSTRKRTAEMLAEEIRDSVEEARAACNRLRDRGQLDPDAAADLEAIVRAVDRVESRAGATVTGPRSLLGVERTLQMCKADPALADKRVLVVDDDAEIREEIEAILQKAGCRVTACESGQAAADALKSAAERGEAYHAVVSDVKLPDFNGYEIYQTVRDCFENVPVILMTGFGYDPHHSIVRASQEGLQSILFKPFKADQLLDEIHRAVAEQ